MESFKYLLWCIGTFILGGETKDFYIGFGFCLLLIIIWGSIRWLLILKTDISPTWCNILAVCSVFCTLLIAFIVCIIIDSF